MNMCRRNMNEIIGYKQKVSKVIHDFQSQIPTQIEKQRSKNTCLSGGITQFWIALLYAGLFSAESELVLSGRNGAH